MDLNTRMISAPYSIPHKEKAALYEEFQMCIRDRPWTAP